VVNQNDAIAVCVHDDLITSKTICLSFLGHWFKLVERQYVDLSDFGITEEMQKPAAH